MGLHVVFASESLITDRTTAHDLPVVDFAKMPRYAVLITERLSTYLTDVSKSKVFAIVVFLQASFCVKLGITIVATEPEMLKEIHHVYPVAGIDVFVLHFPYF